MNITKRLLDLSPRPKLRLSEIEKLIRKHRIVVPPPSRRTLVALCEEGKLETAKRSAGLPYLVFEDSFLKWVKELDETTNR